MPTTDSIWTSPEARARLLELYAQRLATLDDRVEVTRVPTRFGETQVLLAGPHQAPALVVIHGANGDAAQMAGAYLSLAADYRCVFVDVPGQANPSEGQPIPRGDGSLAAWMRELLDGLELDSVALLGMSGGAYTALRSALGLRERIRCVVGLVPEGFCELAEVPPTSAPEAEAFVELVTGPECGFPRALLDLMARGAALAFDAVHEPIRLGPLFEAEEFVGFEVPVLLVAGGQDRLFPGARVLERARAIVPGVRTHLIETANHIDLRLYRGEDFERVVAFLRTPG